MTRCTFSSGLSRFFLSWLPSACSPRSKNDDRLWGSDDEDDAVIHDSNYSVDKAEENKAQYIPLIGGIARYDDDSQPCIVCQTPLSPRDMSNTCEECAKDTAVVELVTPVKAEPDEQSTGKDTVMVSKTAVEKGNEKGMTRSSTKLRLTQKLPGKRRAKQ